MPSGMERLFICSPSLRLLGELSVNVFDYDCNQVVFLLLSFKVFFGGGYILDNNRLSDVLCKYFLSVCGLSPYSLNAAFPRAEVLNFNEVQLISYFFHRSCPWCCIQKSITIPKGIWVLSCVLAALEQWCWGCDLLADMERSSSENRVPFWTTLLN